MTRVLDGVMASVLITRGLIDADARLDRLELRVDPAQPRVPGTLRVGLPAAVAKWSRLLLRGCAARSRGAPARVSGGDARGRRLPAARRGFEPVGDRLARDAARAPVRRSRRRGDRAGTRRTRPRGVLARANPRRGCGRPATGLRDAARPSCARRARGDRRAARFDAAARLHDARAGHGGVERGDVRRRPARRGRARRCSATTPARGPGGVRYVVDADAARAASRSSAFSIGDGARSRVRTIARSGSRTSTRGCAGRFAGDRLAGKGRAAALHAALPRDLLARPWRRPCARWARMRSPTWSGARARGAAREFAPGAADRSASRSWPSFRSRSW